MTNLGGGDIKWRVGATSGRRGLKNFPFQNGSRVTLPAGIIGLALIFSKCWDKCARKKAKKWRFGDFEVPPDWKEGVKSKNCYDRSIPRAKLPGIRSFLRFRCGSSRTSLPISIGTFSLLKIFDICGSSCFLVSAFFRRFYAWAQALGRHQLPAREWYPVWDTWGQFAFFQQKSDVNQRFEEPAVSNFCLSDSINGECFRADLLISEKLRKIAKAKSADQTIHREIEEILAKLDSFTPAELEEIIKKYEIKSPLSNNPLSAPMEFNLMFECTLGPEGKNSGFLRPETAQGKCSIYNSTLAKHWNKLWKL